MEKPSMWIVLSTRCPGVPTPSPVLMPVGPVGPTHTGYPGLWVTGGVVVGSPGIPAQKLLAFMLVYHWASTRR